MIMQATHVGRVDRDELDGVHMEWRPTQRGGRDNYAIART